ncbi:STAS domain-containing protein [Streptomyces sp. NPDC093509]|uniref:STAS domain-containing protein n=1 Tax=Streptomyces sp. NPDC093509 TaxID=3154982 RepID=UPI00344D58AA
MENSAEQNARLSTAQTTNAGIQVLACQGELDADTVDALRQALQAVDSNPMRWVLDLSGVTFMDSSAINVLVAARRTATASGGWIRLAALTAPVQRVIEIVGLDTIIPCYPTLPQALAA